MEAQLDDQVNDEGDVENEDVREFIQTCETSDAWTIFRNNLSQNMYDSWLARRNPN